jgi:hypothetical protein
LALLNCDILQPAEKCRKLWKKSSFEAEFDLQCNIVLKAKVLMHTTTKEQQCRLANEDEEDSGNHS